MSDTWHKTSAPSEISPPARDSATGYTLLRETSRLISSIPDISMLLELLYEEIRKLIPSDTYFVTLYDQTCNEVSVEVMIDEGERFPRTRQRLTEGLTKWVIDNRRPLLVRDMDQDDLPVAPIFMGKKKMSRSWLGVPMLLGDRVIGTLVAASYEPAVYSEEDEDVLLHVASQAAVAIENARLYQEAQKRVRELGALLRVSLEIVLSLNLPAILDLVVGTALELTHASDAHIFLYDEAIGSLSFGAALWSTGESALRAETTPRPDGITMASIRSGEAIVICDCESHPLFVDPARRLGGLKSIASFPLRRAPEVLGALNVAFLVPHEFGEDEMRLMSLLADQAAIAIKNARLYQELEEAFDRLKRSQAQLVRAERMRALAELSAGVAHDFNNVLTSILGRVQLMLLQVSDPSLRESLKVIEQAARNGAQTVRRIMGFALHREGEELVPVDVNRIVEDAILLTEPRWRAPISSGPMIDLKFRRGRVLPVMGSAAEISEVLTNLIFNAVDAMPQGGKLLLETRQDGDEAVVRVEDTGIGIPEELMDKLFSPFFTTKGGNSAGMGLSVAREIVARHGGSISVDSQVGRGSIFSVRLPVVRHLEMPGHEEDMRMEELTQRQRSLSILVVEDEESIRRLLSSILGLEGHEVRTYSRAMDGISAFRERTADLVITDLGLPDQSGWEVARQVKAASHSTPVILITGWGVTAEPAEARRRGVDYILPKPFEFEELSELISRALAEIDPE